MSRIPKVEAAIQETVALILQQELHDPRITMVTVTRVRATADLQHAVISYSFLGTGDRSTIEKGLTSAAPYIRRLLGERLRLRFTPELRFQYDPSIQEAIRLQRLMDPTTPPESSTP